MIRKILTKIANQTHYYKYLHPSKLDAVFVVSTGRTGTKFFETFFKIVGDNTYAVHEPQPDFFDLSISKHRKGKSKAAIQNYIISKRDPQIRSLCARRIKRYVECNPFLSFLLPDIKTTYKQARFLVITRAAKTYIKSALNKSPLDDGKFYFYDENDKRQRLTAGDFEGDPHQKSWATFSRKEKIAWYWNKCNVILLNFMQQHPRACLHLHFEAIFSKDRSLRQQEIEKILHFLGVKIDQQLLGRLLDLGDQKKNHTQAVVFEGFEDWTEKEQQQFEELTAEASKRISEI